MRSVPKLALIAALLVLTGRGAAAGQFMDGNRLYDECTSMFNVTGNSFCQGYVAAIADAFADGKDEVGGRRACLPGRATIGQLSDIVRRRLTESPETRHRRASALVAEALSDAFPCRQ